MSTHKKIDYALVAMLIVFPVLFSVALLLPSASALEEEEETHVADKVTLEVIRSEDRIKLDHAVSLVGNFEGLFNFVINDSYNSMSLLNSCHAEIATEGEYNIAGEIMTLELDGEFEITPSYYYNPSDGRKVSTTSACKDLTADLYLKNELTQVQLNFTGSNCRYGYMSYVVGTFDVVNSTGKYDISEGEGRITFVADHHTDIVSGELKGSLQ